MNTEGEREPEVTTPMTQRTSHVELPKGDEIMHISNAEEKRALLPERVDVHFPDFTPIIDIFDHYKLDTSIFTEDELSAKHVLDTGAAQIKGLVDHVLAADPSEEEVALLQGAYAYLSEEDEPQPSDYIFVFGAKTALRAEKAVELYDKGLAPKIILSGRGPFYGKSEDVTEAEKYAALAIEAGVPQEALIIEGDSITVPDNIRRTLNMMDAQGMPYHSFIIVNSPYTQRRGWCTWKKHTPEDVDIYRVNCGTGPDFARDTWYKNPNGLNVVLGEFIKLRNTIAFNDA